MRGKRKSLTIRPILKETLEQVAAVMGPTSGAAQALADAAKHDGPVNFYVTGHRSYLVEHLPKADEPKRAP